MSTRATYRFRFEPEVTLYLHFDGYPEGAALHLKDAYTPEAFIRKNGNAEITTCHEGHGDTEYRYEICRDDKGFQLQVLERAGPWNDPHWNTLFIGSMEHFLDDPWRRTND